MKYFSLELIELVAEYCSSSKDKSSLSLVNHHFYSAVTRLLYKHVMIKSPRQYIAFKTNKNDQLKRFVCRLDFSSYTTRGSRYSVEKAKSIVMANELANMILECHYLKELFVGEELMHAFVSARVIRSIFCHQNHLRTLDFTGFCDRSFTTVMADMFKPNVPTKLQARKSTTVVSTVQEEQDFLLENWSIPSKLQHVSFYMCMALSQEHFFIPFFDKMASSGNRLTKLDLAYTQITSDIFAHMAPENYQHLTHLNLQACHSLSCCSPLIPFLEQCTELIELNLNIDFNGIGGSRFCQGCIYKIMTMAGQMKSLTLLDMGGHTHLDDTLLMALQLDDTSKFRRLEKLGLTYCKEITLDVLQKHFLIHLPNLYYLNLARTPLTTDLNYLPRVINQLSNHLEILEISPFTPKKYPQHIKDWTLTVQGRRSFYSKTKNPCFVYSKKLILVENQVLSPMNKYFCYSY